MLSSYSDFLARSMWIKIEMNTLYKVQIYKAIQHISVWKKPYNCNKKRRIIWILNTA